MSALLRSVLSEVVASDRPMAGSTQAMLAMAIISIAFTAGLGVIDDIYNIVHPFAGPKAITSPSSSSTVATTSNATAAAPLP
eukprot:1157838-Amphidinium_carterae.2